MVEQHLPGDSISYCACSAPGPHEEEVIEYMCKCLLLQVGLVRRIWRVRVCACADMCVCLHRHVVQLGGSRPFHLVPVAGAPGVPVPIG